MELTRSNNLWMLINCYARVNLYMRSSYSMNSRNFNANKI